jgi:hypothetical protein
MSLASLEDDRFFSAFPSQPASRLMSIFASGQENESPEDVNSTRRPSEPLVSVCLPLAETAQPAASNDKGEPVAESLPNRHDQASQHRHFCAADFLHRLGKTKPHEPVLQPRAASCDDTTSTESSNWQVDKLLSSLVPVITTRCWSSVPCGHHAFATCSCRGHLPVTTRAQLDGYISKQEIDVIICNIRVYLSVRQHRDCARQSALQASKENAGHSSTFNNFLGDARLKTSDTPEDEFMATTDDIAAILDIIVAGIRRIQDKSTQSECQSLLFPGNAHVKPSVVTRKIIPGMPAVADPATTIFSIRPCFSLASDSKDIECLNIGPNATYISRQSITEIN